MLSAVETAILADRWSPSSLEKSEGRQALGLLISMMGQLSAAMSLGHLVILAAFPWAQIWAFCIASAAILVLVLLALGVGKWEAIAMVTLVLRQTPDHQDICEGLIISFGLSVVVSFLAYFSVASQPSIRLTPLEQGIKTVLGILMFIESGLLFAGIVFVFWFALSWHGGAQFG